jgi:hypothetical protein
MAQYGFYTTSKTGALFQGYQHCILSTFGGKIITKGLYNPGSIGSASCASLLALNDF